MIRNPPTSSGYSDSKGVFSARKAVMHYTQEKGVVGVGLDDIYIGNGASELIVMATQALLNDGDEVLLPAPDYPPGRRRSACRAARRCITSATSRTRGCPISTTSAARSRRTRRRSSINPNNPTGALYSDELLLELLEIARQHGLIVFADEVYDKIVYDGLEHTALGSLSEDVITVTFNSSSKSYRSCGYRAGWMAVRASAATTAGTRRIISRGILSSMRCARTCPGSSRSRRRSAAIRASTS